MGKVNHYVELYNHIFFFSILIYQYITVAYTAMLLTSFLFENGKYTRRVDRNYLCLLSLIFGEA